MLLNFTSSFLSTVHNTTWKTRNHLFKEWKMSFGITKRSFTNYRRDFPSPPAQRGNPRQQNERSEIIVFPISHPHNSFRHISQLLHWIYWTLSNFEHNSPWFYHIHSTPPNLVSDAALLSDTT